MDASAGPVERSSLVYQGGQTTELQRLCDLLRDSIERYGRGWSSYDRRNLRQRHSADLNFANPYSTSAVQTLISPHLLARQHLNLHMTTLLHRRWHTTDAAMAVNYGSIMAKVRRECGGISGIFSIEAAYFQNVRENELRVVAPHCQGFCWGEHIERQLRIAARGFDGGDFGSVPIVAKPVYDLAGAIRYSFKHPFREYAIYQRRDGRFWHGERKLRMKSAYRLWRHCRYYGWPDVVFGIGDGVNIIRRLEEECSSWWRLR